MPSINLDLDYFGHPKTKLLVRLLGRGADVLPIRLWCYCGKHHATTGKLTRMTTEDIEQEVYWWGKRGKAVEALVTAGFLDLDADGITYCVHNWEFHSGHIKAFKERAKKAAEARWKKPRDGPGCSEVATSNATSTASSNALTKHSKITPLSPFEDRHVLSEGCSDQESWLARQWIFYLRRKPLRNELDDAKTQFGEWVRLGAKANAIEAEIKSDKRDRTETLWEMKRRLVAVSGPSPPDRQPQKSLDEQLHEAIAHNRKQLEAIK